MHPCAALLDEIEALAVREEEALLAEDEQAVGELAAQRTRLLHQAWSLRAGFPEEKLRERLLGIQGKQERLQNLASHLHERLRGQLADSRKRSNYFAGARHYQAQMHKSHYFHKTS